MTKGKHLQLHDLIKTEGMVEVASLGAASYDWDQTNVYYHPVNDRWYWLSESGCSCSNFGDWAPYSLGDLEDGDRQAAIRALRANANGFDDTESETAAVRDYKHEVTK